MKENVASLSRQSLALVLTNKKKTKKRKHIKKHKKHKTNKLAQQKKHTKYPKPKPAVRSRPVKTAHMCVLLTVYIKSPLTHCGHSTALNSSDNLPS